MRASRLLLTSAALLCLLPAGCDFPRDQRGTLDRVAGGTLRVGYVENEPWVVEGEEGEPAGVEAELVRGFARELDARVEWTQGTVAELVEALEHLDLDLLVGGLSPEIPGLAAVATTDPYHTGWVVVGVPPGAAVPESLRGVEVAVEAKDFASARRVAGEGGRARRVADLAAARGPVAAPDWKVEALGFRATEIELSSYRRVIALPPGENAFLIRLERYLWPRRAEVAERLRRQAR